MNFRTELSITSKQSISHKHSIVSIGSCFADAIGKRLKDFKFQTLVNPYGSVYNPCSIHKLLHLGLKNELPPESSYLKKDDVYFNYFFHSKLSSLNEKELRTTIDSTIREINQKLQISDTIIITYGTAWVYKRKEEGDIVNNCHKQAASLFNKELLSEKEIQDSFDSVYQAIKKVRPNLRLILTLSPVRHIKDTLELNAVSKAILRTSCYHLSQQYSDVDYFPAYEIMMDDLRDYRFYKDDLIHPTAFAEDYIWEKFEQTYFDADTVAFIKKWKEIKNAMAHKPFHPSSTAHQQFLKSLYAKVSELKNVVNVEEELSIIKSQITAI